MKLKDLPKKLLAKESFEVEESPQKVDEILEAKYGFGLYPFSHCLADLLFHELLILDSKDIFAGFKLPEKYWHELIDKLEELKVITIKRLDAIDTILNTFDWSRTMPSLYEYKEPEELTQGTINGIIKRYRIKSFFKAIDGHIERLNIFKSVSPTDMRGRPLKSRNLIALIWSYVMKKPDTKSYDWKGMADLFDWFLYNLNGTYYEKTLSPQTGEESFDAFNLKRVVLRLKANLRKNEFLDEKVEILQGHYFTKTEIKRLTTIEFDKPVYFADDAPSIGGDIKSLKWKDKNLLITFPNGKMLPRPGKPAEKEDIFLPPLDWSKSRVLTPNPKKVAMSKKVKLKNIKYKED